MIQYLFVFPVSPLYCPFTNGKGREDKEVSFQQKTFPDRFYAYQGMSFVFCLD